jgi:hypothetical protein
MLLTVFEVSTMGKKFLIVACALPLVLALCASSHAWPIPDTGQTKCYNNTGEIPCPQPGEPFYGQDGNYTINPPSYTKLAANGNDLPDDATEWVMVRDNVTGLIWENKIADGSIHDGSKAFTWCDTNPATNGGNQGICGTGAGDAATDTEAFIRTMNSSNFGGFSDWRMPSRKELKTIVDYGRYNPAINAGYFANTAASNYWCSTTNVSNTGYAWSMNFYYGEDNYGYAKGDNFYVRAVRSGDIKGHFIDNGDGTVTDPSSGLMWQQTTAPGSYTWEQALSYCENLALAGYTDWRLPTIRDLDSIVDLNIGAPAIDSTYFPDTVPALFWSASPGVYDTTSAWSLAFNYGYGLCLNKPASLYIRSVRGGQPRMLGHLFISAPSQSDRWVIGKQKIITWDSAGLADNVNISVSRQGGEQGTFEVIAESIANNGSYTWGVTGPESFSCELSIEPRNDAAKGTTQGLFSIVWENVSINAEEQNDPGHYKLTFSRFYTDGISPADVIWASSDPNTALISGNLLTALKNGYVEVSTTYELETYKKGLFVYTTTDAAEIESNNTKATANTMSEGRFYQGKVLVGDTDWFKFTLPTASLLDIGFLSYSTTADVNVEIYNSSDVLMASGRSTDGNYLIFPLGLPSGTYYLKLSPAWDIDQDNKYVVTYKVLGALPSKVPVPLSLGETKPGTINNLADFTDFTFSLSQEQGVSIFFIPSGDLAKYRVSLLDNSSAVVDQVDCVGYLPVNLEAVHTAGNYTLRVTPIDSVDGGSPFTVQLTASTQQVEEEENNTAITATSFDISRPIGGRISTDTDVDFFSFDLASPRFIALAFSCAGSTGSFRLTVYRESEDNPIDAAYGLTGQVASLHMGLGIGRYFIKVAGNFDTVHQYTLAITDSDQINLEIESNNTLRFANAIDTATSRKGRIYSGTDKDYYGFHLAEEGFFTVHFTPSTTTGDYRVSVVDENDFQLESYTSYNGQVLNEEMYNIPRNFYIKIEPSGNIDQYDTYEVSLSSTCQIVGLKQLVAVSVSGPTANMTTGGTQNATAIASYSDATTEMIASPIWSSLNEAVATVDAGGLVTAVAEGSTSIVASYGGLTGKFDVIVDVPAQTVSQHYGNLILVAGGGADFQNTLKESTQYLSDLVYLRFRNRLFADKDIYYFNPVTWHDIDGDGFDNNVVDDSSPTVAEFGQAITQWASSQSTDGPLYVYLIDHGGIDTFKVFPNEILTAAQLKTYLDQFQQATGRKVVVVIEACKSGSFTDDLVTQGQNRIVVTSTDDQDAYLQLAGKISFTQFFIDRLLTGDSVQQGWLKAKLQLNNMGLPYSLMAPQLAEGLSMVSAQTWVGGDFAIASLYPEIVGQSSNMFISANTTQTFFVDISDLEGIEAVWSVVLPSNYVPPPPSQDLEAPKVILPTFDLTDPGKDGRYEGNYSDFAYNGEYRITFYARNAKGNVSVSAATIATVTGGQDITVVPGDVNGDGFVTLTDAVIALKGLVGQGPAWVNKGADVNGDGRIGMAEVLYILQKAAGRR